MANIHAYYRPKAARAYLIAVPLLGLRFGKPANATAAEPSTSSKSAAPSFVPNVRTPVVSLLSRRDGGDARGHAGGLRADHVVGKGVAALRDGASRRQVWADEGLA